MRFADVAPPSTSGAAGRYGETRMTRRDGPPQPAPPPAHPEPYPADKARGAAIVLRTRAMRVIFALGLVAAVLLALAFA